MAGCGASMLMGPGHAGHDNQALGMQVLGARCVLHGGLGRGIQGLDGAAGTATHAGAGHAASTCPGSWHDVTTDRLEPSREPRPASACLDPTALLGVLGVGPVRLVLVGAHADFGHHVGIDGLLGSCASCSSRLVAWAASGDGGMLPGGVAVLDGVLVPVLPGGVAASTHGWVLDGARLPGGIPGQWRCWVGTVPAGLGEVLGISGILGGLLDVGGILGEAGLLGIGGILGAAGDVALLVGIGLDGAGHAGLARGDLDVVGILACFSPDLGCVRAAAGGDLGEISAGVVGSRLLAMGDLGVVGGVGGLSVGVELPAPSLGVMGCVIFGALDGQGPAPAGVGAHLAPGLGVCFGGLDGLAGHVVRGGADLGARLQGLPRGLHGAGCLGGDGALV